MRRVFTIGGRGGIDGDECKLLAKQYIVLNLELFCFVYIYKIEAMNMSD